MSTSLPNFGCTTSFGPSRLTTVPGTRTGVPSARAGGPLRTSAVNSEQAARVVGNLGMGVSSWLAGFKPRRILSTADDVIVHDLMTSAADRAYRRALSRVIC